MRNRHFIMSMLSGAGSAAANPPPPAGTAPTITSSPTFSVAEDQTTVGTLTATGDTPITWSIDSGADAAHFTVNPSTGALAFGALKDFDTPADANGDNDFVVTVKASNGVSPDDTMALTITLTDVADIVPIVTASQSFSVSESVATSTYVGTVAVTAGDSSVTSFAITSGNTGTAFAISSSGVITTAAALDYATLASYTLGVTATNTAGTSSAVNVGITVTEAVAWPVADTFTPETTTSITDMSIPAHLTPTVDAGVTTTNLMRISDFSDLPAPSSGPGWNNLGPIYAAQQAWSLNGSKLLLSSVVLDWNGALLPTYAYTNLHIYNGVTGAYVQTCVNGTRGLPPTAHWSNSTDDEIIFVETSSGAASIQKYTPSTNAFSTIKDFSATYDMISPDWCGGVSDPSMDGRYWALGLRKPSTVWYVVCWDRDTDTVLCEIEMPSEPGNSPFPQVEMSRSGTYVTIAATADWTEAGTESRGKGISIYQRDGTFLRTFWHGPGSGIGDQTGATSIIGHQGNAQDTSGNDVYIYMYSDDGNYETRRFKSIRLDGTQSMPGRDESDNGYMMGLHYAEAYSYAAPGWVVVSDFPVTSGNSGYNGFPLRGYIWAFKVDGSKTIYPIAQSRYSLVDYTAGDSYYLYPWATPNRDMTKIIFKSTFDTDWSGGGGGIPTACHAIIASAA